MCLNFDFLLISYHIINPTHLGMVRFLYISDVSTQPFNTDAVTHTQLTTHSDIVTSKRD